MCELCPLVGWCGSVCKIVLAAVGELAPQLLRRSISERLLDGGAQSKRSFDRSINSKGGFSLEGRNSWGYRLGIRVSACLLRTYK